MPQPCSQPLKTNPFESYRDPDTGQWKVRHSASATAPSAVAKTGIELTAEPATPVVMTQSPRPTPIRPISEEDIKLIPKRRRWQKPTRPQKVASQEVA